MDFLDLSWISHNQSFSSSLWDSVRTVGSSNPTLSYNPIGRGQQQHTNPMAAYTHSQHIVIGEAGSFILSMQRHTHTKYYWFSTDRTLIEYGTYKTCVCPYIGFVYISKSIFLYLNFIARPTGLAWQSLVHQISRQIGKSFWLLSSIRISQIWYQPVLFIVMELLSPIYPLTRASPWRVCSWHTHCKDQYRLLCHPQL